MIWASTCASNFQTCCASGVVLAATGRFRVCVGARQQGLRYLGTMNNGAGVLSKSSASVTPVPGEYSSELADEDADGVEARATEPGPMGVEVPAAFALAEPLVSAQVSASVVSEPVEDPIASQQVITERIRAANLDFLHRVNDAMSLPIQVLIAQRDAALAEIAEAEKRARTEHHRAHAEHERFISYLMEEQLMNLRHVREQLDAAKEELQRARALAAPRVAGVALARDASLSRKVDTGVRDVATPQGTVAPQAAESREARDGSTFESFSDGLHADAVATGSGESALQQAIEQIEKLRDELQAAFREIDETRVEAARLQDERDEAIRATDDVRVELQAEIDAARDETFEVQTRLDELSRQLDDARDEARDEALRLNEVIDDTQRQLDERNEEVHRLRARLEDGADEVKHSQPPPPRPASELEAARREVKWLRQQLIVAKRQISRAGADPSGARVRTTKATRGPGSEPNKPVTSLGKPRESTSAHTKEGASAEGKDAELIASDGNEDPGFVVSESTVEGDGARDDAPEAPKVSEPS